MNNQEQNSDNYLWRAMKTQQIMKKQKVNFYHLKAIATNNKKTTNQSSKIKEFFNQNCCCGASSQIQEQQVCFSSDLLKKLQKDNSSQTAIKQSYFNSALKTPSSFYNQSFFAGKRQSHFQRDQLSQTMNMKDSFCHQVIESQFKIIQKKEAEEPQKRYKTESKKKFIKIHKKNTQDNSVRLQKPIQKNIRGLGSRRIKTEE